ncbi:hypothetical protein BX600DRAFT_455798 [Xylariales sp. PMI_506]|nr:hypothetical protein BX600DRAFT_455798 [Xylariales sp. PMI_506]
MAPPIPGMTEADLTSQVGRVFIITGGYSGCGFELAKILYHLNGTVYIAGRSKEKAWAAIETIASSAPSPDQTVTAGQGTLHYLSLDLADLRTIRSTAEEFLAKEHRLDIIWHNAGVMVPPDGSTTAQGHDLQVGVNAYGPYLLQRLLTPVMLETAARDRIPKYATRVIWLSSNAHSGAPKPDGVNWEDLNNDLAATGFLARLKRYAQSKAMNNIYASHFARLHGESEGIASLSVHPGRLESPLQKDLPWIVNAVFRWGRQHPRFGALTELYAGFCKLNTEKNGGYITAYGQFEAMASHVASGLGDRGTGQKLWQTTEAIVKDFIS